MAFCLINYVKINSSSWFLSETKASFRHRTHQGTPSSRVQLHSKRGESSHPLVKGPTNRHTPIGQSVEKIAVKVGEVTYTYEYELEHQKKNNPRRIDVSRSFLTGLFGRVAHQAIKFVYPELIPPRDVVLNVERIKYLRDKVS